MRGDEYYPDFEVFRAHHAFVDGKHISHFVDLLTKLWAEPESR